MSPTSTPIAASTPEVRRCGACGAAQAVCEREWQHTTMGLPSGSTTRDFCCQACGRRFSLVPMRRVWTFTVMSVLLCWTCVFPLVGGAMALVDYWPYQANPVVPGAPLPTIRFRAAEPLRRCARCGGIARCLAVTRTRSRGLPTGTTFTYTCDKCTKDFTIASVGGHVFNVVGAIVCFVFGFGCLPFGIVLWLMALGILAISGAQLLAQARNPLIAEAVAG